MRTISLERPGTDSRLRWALSMLAIVLLATACDQGRDGAAPPSPASDRKWRTLAPAPSQRTEVTAAAVGNSIYIAGGFTPDGSTVASVEVYDVQSNAFRTSPDLPIAVNHAMSAAHDGVFYVIGGYTRSLSDPTDRAFAFRDGSWRELPRMPRPVAAGGAAMVGGKVYVAGGVSSGGLSTTGYVFDPATGRWASIPGSPAPREHLGVAGYNGLLYVVGGRSPSNVATVEVFDPATRGWERLPDLPTPRGGLAAAATANGFIVAPGGEQNSGTFGEAEAFEVRRKRWVRLPDLPTPRHGLGVASVGNTVYVISGGPEPGFAFSNANEALDLGGL